MHYQGQYIGDVQTTGSTIHPGTLSGHDIYDLVPDNFECKVTAYGQASSRGGSTKTTLVAEIEVGNSGSVSNSGENKIITCKVSGPSSKYGGKSIVIEEFNKKNLKVFLGCELDKDRKIVLIRETTNDGERLAGRIEEKELSNCATLEEIQLVKELIEKGEDLEAKVTAVNGLSYFVTFSISADVINQCKTEVAKVAIDETKQDLIAKGFKEETLTAIEDFLFGLNIPVSLIQSLFKTYKEYPPHVQHRIVEMPKVLFHDDFDAILTAFAAVLSNNYHLLLSGDKGTGKNCCIETLAWLLQRPLYAISINRDTDKLDLMGSRTIDTNIDEDGNVINKITFSPEVMLEAMEVGGIINIDEINFADPGVTGLLHSICDDRRAVEVPGYKKVKADDNFCVMGTMNIDYQGTNELNEALADRFVDIMFPANISIFDVLARACSDVPESEIQKADKIYQKMYSIVQDRDSSLDSSCLTVRGFIQGLHMSKVLGLKKALKVCVANKVKDDEYRTNVENIIENII